MRFNSLAIENQARLVLAWLSWRLRRTVGVRAATTVATVVATTVATTVATVVATVVATTIRTCRSG